MKSNKLLSGALFYRRLGWPVFPVKPLAKEPPLVPHGCKDATLDEKLIHQWWAKHPRANVAIATGKAFWALDVDPRHGGDESLRLLIHKHGPLPETIQQTTANGGTHYLFTIPARQKIGCFTDVWPGIDVRGDGGYILAPPSALPDHKTYVWDGLNPLTEQKIAPAASWLLAGLGQKNSPNATGTLPERFTKGSQHDTLFRLGCSLRGKGCSEAEIFALLWEANKTRCEEPGEEKNIRRMAASICSQYAAGTLSSPLSNGHVASVDLDALPPSLDLLNAMKVFGGRVRFARVWRRGPMVLATTTENRQIMWPTMTDLVSFGRARVCISEGAAVLLPQPKRTEIHKVWDAAAELIMRIADGDAVHLEPPQQAEVKDLLILMWRHAEQPTEKDSGDFLDFLTAISGAIRNKDTKPPPCVFLAEGYCWVHVPTLRNWLSLPTLTNRLYPLADIRAGLLLLGFQYVKDVTRGYEGESMHASLWRGPTEVLMD